MIEGALFSAKTAFKNADRSASVDSFHDFLTRGLEHAPPVGVEVGDADADVEDESAEIADVVGVADGFDDEFDGPFEGGIAGEFVPLGVSTPICPALDDPFSPPAFRFFSIITTTVVTIPAIISIPAIPQT